MKYLVTTVMCFVFALIVGVKAQTVTDYRLLLDKCEMGNGALKIACDLTIDFAGQDSVSLDFGGNLEELAVTELQISPDTLRYHFNAIAKKITFYNVGAEVLRIQMGYIFSNLTSVFMYNNSGAEIWECIYGPSAEYYYPMRRGVSYSGKVKFAIPQSLSVVLCGGCDATQWQSFNQCVPLNFAFLHSNVYEKTTMNGDYMCDVYQLKGKEADAVRYNLLCDLTAKAIRWYEEKYGEQYICTQYGASEYPAFIFHDGNASFNRYNMGFVSASQEKFATYPDIYPLIHEIGHRWMGEYSMFIDSGERGYAFIIETLNEFMTLMCIRDIVGVEEYRRLLDDCREQYEKIAGTDRDVHPVDMTQNNNISVTYRKGPLMLDAIAQEVGYDEVLSAIVNFYKSCNGKPHLRYEDFESFCKFTL